MLRLFEKLIKEEAEVILKAPVLASLFVATRNKNLSVKCITDAIKLAHIKTYTAVPILSDYYSEVEKNFKVDLEAAERKYTPFDDAKRIQLRSELSIINKAIFKLDEQFATTLINSLNRYAEHEKKAEHAVIEDFVFPFILPGFND
jgi:hypothetical protein